MVDGRLIVIHPNGATRTETIGPAEAAAILPKLQEAVDGYIEVVPGWRTFDGGPCVAFCNENGKLQGLPPNRPATELWGDALGFDPRKRGDWLVGSIAIVAGPEELLREL